MADRGHFTVQVLYDTCLGEAHLVLGPNSSSPHTSRWTRHSTDSSKSVLVVSLAETSLLRLNIKKNAEAREANRMIYRLIVEYCSTRDVGSARDTLLEDRRTDSQKLTVNPFIIRAGWSRRFPASPPCYVIYLSTLTARSCFYVKHMQRIT